MNEPTGATFGIRRSTSHSATVTAAVPLTPRMRRITLQAPTLAGVEIRPAQDVELFLRDDSGRRVKRRYTIREAHPDSGTFGLDVLLHGRGPGSSWAAGAQAGDAVEFQGPRGKLALTDARWHLLVGDESAAPAIAEICAALPPDQPASALIEVDGPADEFAMAGPATVHWVHRDGRPPGQPDLLADALGRWIRPERPPAGGHAYLMGETRAMVALRPEVAELGIEADAVFVKGYWNLGRPDRLAGRPPGPAI